MHKESKWLPTNTTSLNSTAIDGPKHLTRPSAESSNSLLSRSSSVTVPKRSVARAWKRGPHWWDATWCNFHSRIQQTRTDNDSSLSTENSLKLLRKSSHLNWSNLRSQRLCCRDYFAACTPHQLHLLLGVHVCEVPHQAASGQKIHKRYTKDTNKL